VYYEAGGLNVKALQEDSGQGQGNLNAVQGSAHTASVLINHAAAAGLLEHTTFGTAPCASHYSRVQLGF